MTAIDVVDVRGRGDAVVAETPRAPVAARRARRRPRSFTRADTLSLVACLFSAGALTWLVFRVLIGGGSLFGLCVAAYLLFLTLFWLVTADRLGRLVAADRLATVVVGTVSAALVVPLVWIIGYIVMRGLPALTSAFFTHDQRGITPLQPATAGGGGHAIVGSLEEVAMALALSVPLAVATAVFLNETHSRLRRPVRVVTDAMSGLPSVLAGLFIYTALIIPYAKDNRVFSYNGLMAALALSLTMVPTITRTVEVVLRLVPDGLREAGLAVGASRARVVWSVVLATARTGLTTAVILGIARSIGETAPLLFTSLGFNYFNANPVDGPQESLPLFIYKNIRNPSAVTIERGSTGALVLMLLVLALFGLARFVGRDRTARSARRTRRTSARAPANP